ncbi:MAG: leucine-rich repeat protein [Clostridia bacterium]|nr:leucine-rich repeat protein [Clostridia bacterium]
MKKTVIRLLALNLALVLLLTGVFSAVAASVLVLGKNTVTIPSGGMVTTSFTPNANGTHWYWFGRTPYTSAANLRLYREGNYLDSVGDFFSLTGGNTYTTFLSGDLTAVEIRRMTKESLKDTFTVTGPHYYVPASDGYYISESMVTSSILRLYSATTGKELLPVNSLDVFFFDADQQYLMDVYGSYQLTKINYSDGFTYEVAADGTVTVTGYRGIYTDLVIPETIDGKAVTRIAEGAFANMLITSVALPNAMEEIGSKAFENCSQLNAVYFPEKALTIAVDAFDGSGCYNNGDNWEKGVFYIGAHLIYGGVSGSYTIREGTQVIHNGAFADNIGISSVTVPDSVTVIGDKAFNGCSRLSAIELPDSIVDFGRDVLNGSAYYNTASNWENNVLYADGYLLEAKAALAGAYEIPSGTVMILADAFKNCTKLEQVTVPATVRQIDENAFPKKVILWGYSDTEAQLYAEENGMTFIPLDVAPTLILTAPQKVQYVEGEALDLTGLKILADYGNGVSFDVTEDCTVSGFDTATPGKQTVVFTYREGTASYEVIVLGAKSTADAVYILQALVGLQEIDDPAAWDQNGDGRITIADAVLLLQSLA